MNDPLMQPEFDQPPAETAPVLTPSTRRRLGPFWGVLAVLAVGYLWLWVAGYLFAVSSIDSVAAVGEVLLKLALAGLNVVPFVPLVTLAQVGRWAPTARLLTLGWWGLLAGICWLAMIGLTIAAQTGVAPAGGRLRDAMPPGGWSRVTGAGLLGMGAILLGLLCFAPPGRRLARRFLPIDATSFTDTTALATVIPLLIGCVTPLLVLGDAPVLMLLRHGAPGLGDAAAGGTSSVFDLYAVLAWAVPISLLATGFPLTRSLAGAMQRLAVVRPTGRQVLAAVVIAVAMVPVAFGYEFASAWLCQKFGWPTTDATAFKQLVKFAITPAGIVAVGVTAGVSEELAFRGLLQPRLGLLLSNLLFAAVHALQYHWDALIAVFLVGWVCGLVRRYANTSSSMIVHGLYDAILVTIELIRDRQAHNVDTLIGQ